MWVTPGQFGWKYGVAATWAGIGYAILGSLLAWAVLGRRTRIITQHLDSATMPEFFGKRFGSRSLKIAASAITFLFLLPYTASLYNGLSRLFGMAFDIDYAVCVMVMAVLTGVYVIAGGYMATAINDFIQGIIMIVGIVAVIAAVLNSQGGFMAALDGLARVSDPAAASTPGVFASFFGPDPLNLLGGGAPHEPGHLGPAPDGAEVLRHQERDRRPQGHDHLHRVRPHRRRRVLLPGGLRAAVLRSGGRGCRRL